MHKNTRLLPYMRRAMHEAWTEGRSVSSLAKEYKVSRETVYKVLERARLKNFANHRSVNKRFLTIEYGLKKLVLVEKKLQKRVDRQNIQRYEKEYPGEVVHCDTKRLPLIKFEAIRDKREHLHVAVDDYSRYLTADIFPDKGQYSSAMHLAEVISTAPFNVEKVYSDNGSAYKGRKDHAFVAKCLEHGMSQSFTKVRHPQTNGKAERVIRTLMEEWCRKRRYKNREERRRSLQEYVYWYNHERSHQGIGNITPMQRIQGYFDGLPLTESVNNAGQTYNTRPSQMLWQEKTCLYGRQVKGSVGLEGLGESDSKQLSHMKIETALIAMIRQCLAFVV